MIERWFLSHPRSVGETYLEHFAAALRFAGALLLAGLACAVHALLPALFVRTASRSVDRLHERMVANRTRQAKVRETEAPQPWADYAI